MSDPTLFDAPPEAPLSAFTGKPVARARATDPKPSHQAAARVNVTNSQKLVMRAARLGAARADELRGRIAANGHKISPSGCRTRCRELEVAGLLYIVNHIQGHAVYGLTDSGRVVADRIAREAHAEEREAA